MERALTKTKARRRPPRPPFWWVFADNPFTFASFLLAIALVVYKLAGGSGGIVVELVWVGAILVLGIVGEVYDWLRERDDGDRSAR